MLIIDTGGTFNKRYDLATGNLVVDKSTLALRDMFERWRAKVMPEISCIIGKDSLDFTSTDRMELLAYISSLDEREVIVVHGTDTMLKSAEYVADAELEKSIVFVGAMVPYSINALEATANFASAYGFLLANTNYGVYVSMNALVLPFEKIQKNKSEFRFEQKFI